MNEAICSLGLSNRAARGAPLPHRHLGVGPRALAGRVGATDAEAAELQGLEGLCFGKSISTVRSS